MKNIDIYYIPYITTKNFDYVNIHQINLLYFIIGEVDGYIKETKKNKCLVFGSTDESKEVLTKNTDLWDVVKSQTKTISDKPGNYDERYKKTKFNSDDNLPLNKLLKHHKLAIRRQQASSTSFLR